MMADPVVSKAIEDVASGRDLDEGRAAEVLAAVMEGRADEVQTAGLLIGLRTKGETVEELTGMARTMRRLATPVNPERGGLVDTAGTGGGPSTFNVSTVAGLVAAGAGCAVAKHGNRSNTSRSGSADLLEQLGVPIDLAPEEVARSIDEIGFGFMFAPLHHEAMKHVVGVRRSLGTRTAFNLLGPLTNPAGAPHQVIGVSDRASQDLMAGVLAGLGTAHSLVVSGDDGVDEISIAAPTRILEVRGGEISELTVSPQDLGLGAAPLDEVAGGEPADNAAVARGVLAGEASPARDFVLANAAAAIYVSGLAESVPAAVPDAERSIDTGEAARVLERLVATGDGR